MATIANTLTQGKRPTRMRSTDPIKMQWRFGEIPLIEGSQTKKAATWGSGKMLLPNLWAQYSLDLN